LCWWDVKPYSINQSINQYVCYFTANCFPLLIQHHVDGSGFFRRSWAEYKVGFNRLGGNYWIGNDLLSQLTLNYRTKLRIDLQLRNLSWYYAEYSSFVVLSEATNYRMVATGYSGNIGDAFSHQSYQNTMMFTTYDLDNDMYPNGRWGDRGNCAILTGGGFWYNYCGGCSINGVGNHFYWHQPSAGTNHLLKTSRMWLTC